MFSVLMSVYHKDHPEYFSQALHSLEHERHYIDEVVLVKDGPIGPELEAVIDAHREALPIKVIPLTLNVGLAGAMNAGLRHCRSEWIFRFDADDLCLPGRAALQWRTITCGALDIVGGQIQECDPATLAITGLRKVPCQSGDIRRFLRRRNPFNHMTVCYRKSFIEKIGGYPDIPLKEDYALWAKALACGARVANMPDVVVHARAGSGLVARRGGVSYAKSEFALQWFLRKNGIKSTFSALIDGVARGMVFMAPVSLRHVVFRKLLRQSA